MMGRRTSFWLGAAFFAAGISAAAAACNISDAKLEEAILQKPELRDPANRQMVLDLRALRDAAFILWSYGRADACEQVLANIRELLAEPSMGVLGDSDEDEADQQFAARDPIVRRGGEVQGHRDDKDARPLTVTTIQHGIRCRDARRARHIRIVRDINESSQSLGRVDTRESGEFGRHLVRRPRLPAAAALTRFRSTT